MIQSLNRKKLTIGNTAVEMDRIFCQFCYPVSGQISNSISYRISGLRSNWVSLIFYHLYYHGVWGEGNANPLFAACPLSFLIINLYGCGYPCDVRFSKVWFTIPPPPPQGHFLMLVITVNIILEETDQTSFLNIRYPDAGIIDIWTAKIIIYQKKFRPGLK